MGNFIGKIANCNKNYLINKRQLLVCDSCYWCLSFLPDLEGETNEYFDNCPQCKEDIKRMYISEQSSEGLDSTHLRSKITQYGM